MPESPRVTLYLFGSPKLVFGAEQIASFPTRRAIYLLARLAVGPRRRMTRQELASVLWPDEPYDATGPRLRQELTRLRKAMGEASSVLGADASRVWVEASQLETDVDRFDLTFREAGESADPATRERLLQEALNISREPFLEGALDEWVVAERRRLGQSRYAVLLSLGEMAASRGEHELALQRGNEAVELVPHREDAHLLAMRALRSLGRATEALTQYQTLRQLASDSGRSGLSAAAEALAEEIRHPRLADTTSALPYVGESIGREEELKRLSSWLHPAQGPARLVTLLGPGGVGKTHLLTHGCQRLGRDYEGLVNLVDLSEIADATYVPSAILRSLSLAYVPTDDPLSRLSTVLPRRPFLLALDNVEQFGASILPVLSRLLEAYPLLRIAAASRTALNLRGEHRLVVSPLPVPEESEGREATTKSPSVRLFMSEAESAGAAGLVTESDWPTIAAIVRRLEGLPLGIHLAAPRLRALSPDRLLQSLEQGAGILDTSNEGVPARHRSLRNAIAGSFDLLTPELRFAMACLSVFRGGWSLDAATEVSGLADATQAMNRLLDASLIERVPDSPAPRFRMLESVREYSRSLLDDDRLRQLRERHLDWVMALSQTVADECVDEAMVTRFGVVERELDNVREATRFALDTSPEKAFRLTRNLVFFWLFRTTGFEALHTCRELFARYRHLPASSEMLDASYAQSWLIHFTEDRDATESYNRTVSLGKTLGDRKYEPTLLALQAYRAQNELRYEEADRLLREIEVLEAEVGDERSGGLVMRLKGAIALYRSDFPTALTNLRGAVKWYRSRGEVFNYCRARMNLARTAIEAGDLDLAEAMLSGLVEDIRRIRLDLLLPSVHFVFGRLETERERYDAAMARFEISLEMWQQQGNAFQESELEFAIGRVHYLQGEYQQAGEQFVSAARRWYENDFASAAAVGLVGCSAVMWRMGEQARAARIMAVCLSEFEDRQVRLIADHQRYTDEVAAEISEELGSDWIRSSDLSIEEAVALASATLSGCSS